MIRILEISSQKYGRVTHYTAGQITATNIRPSHVPSPSATWIEVNNVFDYDTFVAGGDSGGPWFSGNTAWGIQSGASMDYEKAYYMALEYLSVLQVSLKLN